MDQYAVIGHPVAHSLSPIIHQRFAAQYDQSISYIKLEAPLDGFVKTVRDFYAGGGKGANVTLPFKEAAYRLADEASDFVTTAGAANTLLLRDDGSIYADNTDGRGFVRDLTYNHGFDLTGKKILLLGAGGAARGLLKPLLAEAPASILIANRTLEKAVQVAEKFKDAIGLSVTVWDAIPAEPYHLIINTTSASLQGQTLELPNAVIDHNTWCYDLMYGKKIPFLTWAQQMGAAQCLDGFGMLVEQAALSFKLWRGVYPQTRSIMAKLHP